MQQSVGCACFAALLLPYSTLDSTGHGRGIGGLKFSRGTNASQLKRMANHTVLRFAKRGRGPRRDNFLAILHYGLGQTSLVTNNYNGAMHGAAASKNTTLPRLVER